MWGLFIASGASIRRGKFSLIESVAVYPLLCSLVGIAPALNDSTMDLAAAVLR
jgi:hypothetical protein